MMAVVDNDLLALLPDELQAQLHLAQDAGPVPHMRDPGVAKLLQVEMTVVVLVVVGGRELGRLHVSSALPHLEHGPLHPRSLPLLPAHVAERAGL